MAGLAARASLQQYAAISRMRLSMLGHALRTRRGGMELAAGVAASLFYLLLASAFGFGFGAGAYYFVAHGNLPLLSILLWAVFATWQMVPLVSVAFHASVDLSSLLRFPLGFGAYYLLFLFFGLFDLATLVGGISLLGIAAGIGLARPALLPPTLLVLLLFALFNLLLTRTVFAWIDRWLAQRRTREILGVCFFLFILSLQLLNPALHQFKGTPSSATVHRLRRLEQLKPLNRVLPPGLAEESIRAFAHREPAAAGQSLAGLLLYATVAGTLLGIRLRAQYRGENLSEAPARLTPIQRRRQGIHLLDRSGPVAAVFFKEAHYLARSYQLLYGLVAPLILMLVFSGQQQRSRHGGPALPGAHFALPLGVLYAFLGLTRILYNNLGADGAGLQFYFTAPVSLRDVLLGKNLFHALLTAVELAAVWLIATLRFGPPPFALATVTLCWTAFAIAANFTAGNLLSIYAPYRVNLSRFYRPQGATTNSLLSLLVQLSVGVIGGLIYFLALHAGNLWLAAPVFLVLALLAALAYWRGLAKADRMARNRIEPLLQDLARNAT